MKHRVSITIEENVILAVMELLRSPEFRNKSHFFEVAAAKMLKERQAR